MFLKNKIKIGFMKCFCLFFVFILILFSCKPKLQEVPYSNNICNATSPFVKKMGFDLNRTAFSSSEHKTEGLTLIEISNQPNVPNKVYQDSSWKMAGFIGPIVTDKTGTTFCAPVPVINILDNPTAEQNNIYKIDPITGKMELFIKLPQSEKITIQNPFGIMGLAYSCEFNCLYVSTVAGSTRKEQLGKIYCINITDKKIQDVLECGDALGIGISYKDGFRKLYFGSARTSDVYNVGLDDKGNFVGNPLKLFSISGLGERGDDKVRKIREDKNGNLNIAAIEFNYNLTAPSEKQENNYVYQYNFGTNNWVKK